ncbi:zinc finger protein 106 isoform X1 [Danaus plexippus]|uniref:zinc finger protein 106 isoform X1 n=1 Tax=Danaus plexippus TaxID=13037 RepID=UPI002AB2154B|nr:zinc finger protein 106 isoform X1 [Danaus plexippus]
MRRGQTRIGGWRNENSRQFSSRNGGNSHFRSSRNYDIPDAPRFPPPSSRSRRPQPYNSRVDNQDQSQEHGDRYRYRNNRHNYLRQPHHSERQILPLIHQRQEGQHRSTFKEPSNFYKDVHGNHFHVNSMGDVDHRQLPPLHNFRQPLISPWATENDFSQSENIFNKSQRPEFSETNKYSDYAGHRPPASDHYGCNPTLPASAIDNSNSFSRSVDDTVDIVRKKILNRNEPQHNSENNNTNQNNSALQNESLKISEKFESSQHEPPAKKRFNRQRNIDANKNCAKIKNKIVHQLFKMDKEKIHKLMDNPNSSNKFEFAISSLITESQNSFNRHMRSVAEKSLSSTSTEFMQNDNNTIYEDTFMKQMQCILDPQDTVFLEDIKPIVMAELSKVLQLDEFEQMQMGGDENINEMSDDQQIYNNIISNTDPWPNENFHLTYFDQPKNVTQADFTRSKSVEPNTNNYDRFTNDQLGYEDSKPLFERRSRRKSYSCYQDSDVSKNNTLFGTSPVKEQKELKVEEPQKLFDSYPQQGVEEEDPFAELDNQYHVAVDHDFIEDDNITIPKPSQDNDESNFLNIQKELKVEIPALIELPTLTETDLCNVEEELTQDDNLNTSDIDNSSKIDKTKELNDKIDFENLVKISTSSNSRKRSIDQRPSHRKEKRRKESCSETTNQCNKDDGNDNDTLKASDKCETIKSVLPKDDNKDKDCTDNNETSNDKSTSEKHPKKKETPKKTPVKDNKTKLKDTISSNQDISPQESSSSCQMSTKTDAKNSLKTIDMFTEQPRKVTIHQAHRNTAITTVPSHKISIDTIIKPKDSFCRQLMRKHVAIQVQRKLPSKETQTVIKKYNSRCSQTIKKKFAVKETQTDDVVSEGLITKSTEPFERMKEIDLEIQMLLQEKFKLYNSMESKDSSHNSMQTLGMTVLNVAPFDGDDENGTSEHILLTEDVIVDNFANIPSEELDQLTFETVAIEEAETPKVDKRNRRRKVSYQSASSESSTTINTRRKRGKSPNISLLEQIITDDRPLEDIISLDDLEVTPQSKKRLRKGKHIGRRRAIKGKKVDMNNIEIKECSVLLIREDFSQYLDQHHLVQDYDYEQTVQNVDFDSQQKIATESDIHVEQNIVNDIQIDMLDVSEDIVVGDNCEDKEEAVVNITVPISEEIILDNSQSSMEDTKPALSQGDECKMYDYSSDENLRRDSIVVSGNADAVLALECVETNFLAACLDGNVYYFNNDGHLLTTLRGSNLAVTCITIVKEKYGTTVYTGSLDSRIRYYDLETGLEKGPECNVLSPIQTMDHAWDTVFVGTRTGFVLQFECKNNMLIPVSSVKFSEQSILALRAMKEGPRKVLLVAARSENVTIKDAQTGLLLRTLVGPKMTVYTLLYEDGKVYCGTSSNQIHVFDYTSGGHAGTHEGGKGAVCLRASGGLLFAGCYDGCVYVYRESEARPFAQIRGPSLMLLSLAIVGTKIIAGYKDRSLYIWKIPLSILQEMIL